MAAGGLEEDELPWTLQRTTVSPCSCCFSDDRRALLAHRALSATGALDRSINDISGCRPNTRDLDEPSSASSIGVGRGGVAVARPGVGTARRTQYLLHRRVRPMAQIAFVMCGPSGGDGQVPPARASEFSEESTTARTSPCVATSVAKPGSRLHQERWPCVTFSAGYPNSTKMLESLVKVIAYFDTLVDRHVSLETIVRSAAALGGCTAGVSLPDQPPIFMRVDPRGTRYGSEVRCDQSVRVTQRLWEEGLEVWLERPEGAMPTDSMRKLERFASSAAIVVERT